MSGPILVGIHPDNDVTRQVLTTAFGWKFVTREDEEVWAVETPTAGWPEGFSFEGSLSDGEVEVEVTIEWP
jgi:hypothetical protein